MEIGEFIQLLLTLPQDAEVWLWSDGVPMPIENDPEYPLIVEDGRLML